LRQGLDLQPLPGGEAPAAQLAQPRFARAITDLLHMTKEDIDELH
jgi:hypothetical protein